MRARPAVAAALLLAGCGGETPTGPTIEEKKPDPVVAAVTVRSPIGPLIALGGSVTLSATATGAGGAAVAADFEWRVVNESVARVSDAGTLTGVGRGSTEVVARATGGVEGRLAIEVAAADLTAIEALLGDPFGDELLSSIGGAGEAALRAVWADCAAGHASGSLSAIVDCVTRAETDLAGIVEPTKRPLAALLGLFTDWIERNLNLNGPEDDA